ncbi:arsenate reductase family protein [Frigidibacter mobilis]|uniref:Arsenate reductase-like protein n=1 Tax=Frigidibacter mobilis TaxID=1335048 RepID=A0A159Z3B5_9RHOB|nr:ArsC/Spx/MgsR family protein [Frigidibacter mobilis]AMY68698.1 arsenate reductase-like protein [Frigidibacter mobilis]
MTLYGIPTCDTCRKALAALRAAGLDPVFRDVRADPLSQAEIARIVDEFGSRAINRTSPSFRSFNAFLRESEPEAQMAAQPTVMKRPVIEHDGRWYLGWDAEVQAALLQPAG